MLLTLQPFVRLGLACMRLLSAGVHRVRAASWGCKKSWTLKMSRVGLSFCFLLLIVFWESAYRSRTWLLYNSVEHVHRTPATAIIMWSDLSPEPHRSSDPPCPSRKRSSISTTSSTRIGWRGGKRSNARWSLLVTSKSFKRRLKNRWHYISTPAHSCSIQEMTSTCKSIPQIKSSISSLMIWTSPG